MEKRVLGRTGLEVSVLGFGGSEIGYERTDVKIVERLLGSALDAGLNVIDTAECYIESEELIGNAVSHRRNEFYLFTKCGHSSGLDYPDWHPKLLTESINRSLKLLKTDYLDLIQLHSCSAEVLRQGEVIEVLRRAREEGKTRFIGYSGDSRDALFAINCGAFDTLQTSINIADQEALELTLPLARKQEMGVIAKRPVANAVWKHTAKPENPYVHEYWERLQKLDYDFLKTDLNEAIGISLRFTLSIPGVHTAIVGTTKPERWIENAELLNQGHLSPEEFDLIRSRWQKVADRDWTGEV
ncbi:MAG: aldo/keto reductase [Acidobacteriota bacterium]|nr:aldo/keto reductase [Acidobacteriota bacterium]